MLFTGSISDIDKNKYDEIWIIVRSLGKVQTGRNIFHVPQLSPSYALYHDYLSWRDNGMWNKEQFENVYKPRFLEEMKSQTELLGVLRERSFTKNILICCFCKDESMCHRSLVKELVEENTMDDFYMLVAGSRTFNDYELLKRKCDHLLQNQKGRIHVVSGGAKGADTLAERYARERNYELHVFPADWDTFGKSAGYRRNEEMHKFISQFTKRGCVCFWDGQSKGTEHNFRLCEQYNNSLRIIKF